MLDATRRRAPTAQLVQGDVFDVEIEGTFDVVVLSFVLHNCDASGRRRLLGRTADVLSSGGRVAVLDWSCPKGRRRAGLWRRFLTVLEPSPSVLEVAGGALVDDLAAASLRILKARDASFGRCRVLIACRDRRGGGRSPVRGGGAVVRLLTGTRYPPRVYGGERALP